MDSEPKLFDLLNTSDRPRPGDYISWPSSIHKKDEAFYTLQIFQCWVCDSITNTATGHMGNVYVSCPASSFCWHHELRAKMLYVHQYPHPRIYREALEQEIAVLHARHKAENFIIGQPNFSQKLEVGNTKNRSNENGQEECCRYYRIPDRSYDPHSGSNRSYHPGTAFRWGMYTSDDLKSLCIKYSNGKEKV